jgi:hypothetical protein
MTYAVIIADPNTDSPNQIVSRHRTALRGLGWTPVEP